MPIYEYRCNACGARLSRFVRTISAEFDAGSCERCGGVDLRRLISRVAIVRAPLDPGTLNKNELLDGVDYSNPASMASFFRKMGDAFHDEPNEHMDEIIGRLDHGEPVHEALDLHMHDHSAEGGSSEGGNAE
jgi:putative FmdB family regulatory protein